VRIFLVRHGESEGNVDATIHARTADHAIPLSARGREQVVEAGRRLDAIFEARWGRPVDAPPVRLWASPYRRTRETADGIRAGAGRWIEDSREHILLCEQQFGLFDGVPDEELPVRFPDEWAAAGCRSARAAGLWTLLPAPFLGAVAQIR
jgi:broad specificity phosphatase PhoE